MKSRDVVVGGKYVAKVSGVLTVIKIVSENPYKGWDALNTTTGKKVRIKTAGRLRMAMSAGNWGGIREEAEA